MNKIIFLSIYLLVCFNYITIAQATGDRRQLYVIELNAESKNFVDQLRLDVLPGDSIQFKSTGGDFSIYIIDAINFLSIEDRDLKVRVNSDDPENTQSLVYIVQKAIVDRPEIPYSVYNITDNSWPDAPPRIIIGTAN